MRDSYGRFIDYLRVSVTDRCNLRCVYCMPPEGVQWQPHDQILRYEEIAEVVGAAARQGISRVRLTGGEPLVRPRLETLVALIAATPGIEEISLTTNGHLLERQAEKLAAAGLRRINVSLDTLQAERFRRITRGGDLQGLWRGIAAAEAVGLAPVKINVVVMRGVNDDELADIARLTLSNPWQVRFIELMPMQSREAWGDGFPTPQQAYMPLSEVLQRLVGLNLEKVEDASASGPAIYYRLPDAAGLVGMISPLSDHQFCSRCNRLRLTADGNLRPCLMSAGEIPLRERLRAGLAVDDLVAQAIRSKPQRHFLDDRLPPQDRYMAQIGG